MTKPQITLLKSLIEISSPSGFEEKISQYIYKELDKFLPKKSLTIDRHNNVIVKILGNSNKTVMIDAHSDTIGFVVNNVDRNGIISLQYVGYGDIQILSARPLTILTEKGEINAVINRKHSHLVEDEEEEMFINISEAEVDIGTRGREKVLKKVAIGDSVVYKPSFYKLDKNYYAGYGFDDKSGCYILIETIKKIIRSKKKPPVNLVFVFSATEETGLTKLKPLISKYSPQLVIETDVTFASDYIHDDFERETGRCELGKGIVLYRGVDIDKSSINLMKTIAKKNKIPLQWQASTGDIGYTSVDMAVEGKGANAMILGIPLRNMHTPVETINIKDLNYGIKLLYNFLKHKNLKSIL